MATMTAPTGTGYTQTPEEQAREAAAWRALRAYIAQKRVLKGKTFLVRGRLVDLKGDKDNPGQPRRVANDYPGAKKAFREVMLAVAECTEPGLGGLEFVKNVGFTFWDGGPKGGNKGGMYLLHQAVYQEEPSRDLIEGGGAFDPDDYCKRPLLLSLQYNGDTPPDSQYYGKRDNLDVFLAGFEPDPEAFVEVMPSGAVVTSSQPAAARMAADELFAAAPVAAPATADRQIAALLAKPAPPRKPAAEAGPPTLTPDQMALIREAWEHGGFEGSLADYLTANYGGRGLAQVRADEYEELAKLLGAAPF